MPRQTRGVATVPRQGALLSCTLAASDPRALAAVGDSTSATSQSLLQFAYIGHDRAEEQVVHALLPDLVGEEQHLEVAGGAQKRVAGRAGEGRGA